MPAAKEEPRQYMKAEERLAQFGSVFTYTQLQDADPNRSKETLIVEVTRWKQRGLIESAGNRSGVYYNLHIDPYMTDQRRIEAAHIIDQGCIRVGGTALAAAHQVRPGVETGVHLARLFRQRPVKIDGVVSHMRNMTWMTEISQFVINEGPGKVPRLSPEAAYADALLNADEKLLPEHRYLLPLSKPMIDRLHEVAEHLHVPEAEKQIGKLVDRIAAQAEDSPSPH